MRVLFDTNIILDVLLDREPFTEPAAMLMSKVERSELQGYISAITLTTIYYLLSKNLGKSKARRYIKLILSLFEIAPVTRIVLEDALNSEFADYEDGVVYQSAIHSGVEFIITRNVKDYKKSSIPVCEPLEFIELTKIL
ncbi:PIN domain-containing protein [Desulfothermus okinawensis JCM 13304]